MMQQDLEGSGVEGTARGEGRDVKAASKSSMEAEEGNQHFSGDDSPW